MQRTKRQYTKIIVAALAVVFVAVSGVLLYHTTLRSRTEQRTQSEDSSVMQEAGAPESQQQSDLPKLTDQAQDSLLVLVNAQNKMPAGTDANIIERDGVLLDERAMEAYGRLSAAAAQAGMSLWISSAYRSEELQGQLYRQEIDENLKRGMDETTAVTVAASAVQPPGYSEHNTGLAIDFNGVSEAFQDTDTYRWLMEHAAEYGFVLRYPQDKQEITGIMYEPWHFRYVGVEHAKEMTARNLCLEEYVQQLQGQ